MILKIFNFQSFKALDSTCSHLHQRVKLSFKALAIVSRYLLKSVWAGNLYLGPFEIAGRICESVIIFKLPVTIYLKQSRKKPNRTSHSI